MAAVTPALERVQEQVASLQFRHGSWLLLASIGLGLFSLYAKIYVSQRAGASDPEGSEL